MCARKAGVSQRGFTRQRSRSKGRCTKTHMYEGNDIHEAELREQIGRNASEAIELRHVLNRVWMPRLYMKNEGNTQAAGSSRSDPPESKCMACLQGWRRNLGDPGKVKGMLKSHLSLKAKMRRILFLEVRWAHSSREVE